MALKLQAQQRHLQPLLSLPSVKATAEQLCINPSLISVLHIVGLKQTSKKEGEGCLTENFSKTMFEKEKRSFSSKVGKKKNKTGRGSNEK